MKKYEAMVMDDPHLPNLRWLRVTHNGVSYSTIRIESNDEILQIISALQQSVQRTAETVPPQAAPDRGTAPGR